MTLILEARPFTAPENSLIVYSTVGSETGAFRRPAHPARTTTACRPATVRDRLVADLEPTLVDREVTERQKRLAELSESSPSHHVHKEQAPGTRICQLKSGRAVELLLSLCTAALALVLMPEASVMEEEPILRGGKSVDRFREIEARPRNASPLASAVLDRPYGFATVTSVLTELAMKQFS
jgi:hypothetical protein